MARSRDKRVAIIPIARINVINPRARNKRTHREIVDNIEAIGLKRPITVTERAGPDLQDMISCVVKAGWKRFVCSERPKSRQSL